MASYLADNALSLLIALPGLTVAALAGIDLLARSLLGVDRLPAAVWRGGGFVGAAITLCSAIFLVLARFDSEHLGYQLVERAEWIPALGAHYFVGVDGINLFLVLLVALLQPVVLLATWHQVERSAAELVACLLVLESALLGLVLSLNLAQFYLFWELTALTLYFVVGVFGDTRRVASATRLIVHSSLGSFLMLTAILILAGLNAEQGGALDLDLVAAAGSDGLGLLETRVAVAAEGVPWWRTQSWLFAGFAAGFAVRIPLIPLHTWLANVLRDTPTAASALVVSAFACTGVYGFLRFALPLLPDAAADAAPLLVLVAALGTVYGGALALVQTEAKQLLAYVALSQLGLATLGAFSLNVHGLVGAVVHALGLGLSLALIVVLLGALEERRSTLCLDDFGGLAKPMPVLTTILGVAILSSVGLPALCGFVGEWLVVLGGFERHPASIALACVGLLVTAIALLRLLARVALGPVENPENRGLIDLDWRERVACLLLVVPIFWIGLAPNPVLRRVEPSVLELLRQMDASRSVVPKQSAPPAKPPSASPTDANGEAI